MVRFGMVCVCLVFLLPATSHALTYERVADINPGFGGGGAGGLTVYDGDLYFSAKDGIHGNELWRYDPVTGPAMVADIVEGGIYDSGNPSSMTPYDGKLYFSADDGQTGTELSYIEGEYTQTTAIFRVPDPATLTLICAGALGLLASRRRAC
ncbi:MAG TPA: PEP-CTERM sorting domain-containing protein [Phycisphaerae bacterium]|nr:PEP-CTERM sorting domain-containing protein [Phycisphaerae bacterium]